MTAKTGQEAWRKDGWHRDPGRHQMVHVFMPERAARLVESDKAYRASFYQLRKTGHGVTAIFYATADELDALTTAFEKLDGADAKLGLGRINESRTSWWATQPILGIKGGYPVREKGAKEPGKVAAEPKLTDVMTQKPKATEKPAAKRRTSANPRTAARQMVNRVIKNAQTSKAIRKATPAEQAQVEAILNAGDSAQE